MSLYMPSAVAPLVGAWIEIVTITGGEPLVHPSLLSWERGLKSITRSTLKRWWKVAPLVGAWIEIMIMLN